MTKPRLAVVLSHPTQYYSPWLRRVAARGAAQLRVFYLWEFGIKAQVDPKFGTTVRWDIDLLSGYESEFVPNTARDPGTHHFGGLRNPGLTRRLDDWQPDAVLMFGYAWASHLRAIAWARLHGIPLIFRGDSHFLGREQPGTLRLLALRLLYRQFGAVTYVGAANRRYFERLGVSARRLHFAPHAVDDSRFDPGRRDVREQTEQLRRSLGLPAGARVVLFAGKLVPAKQPRELLAAFVAGAPDDAWLVFVGEGEEKIALEASAAGHPRVRFLPFANQSEMPSRYLLADLFVLPSRGVYETWGLAVNEAMHMGVPCLVSDRVGCQEDLVIPDETGWVFRSEDQRDLATQLSAALAELSDPARRTARKAAALARISRYTFEEAAEGLERALASVR